MAPTRGPTHGDAQRSYQSIIAGLIKSLETYVYYKDSRDQTGKTQALSAIKGKIAFAPCSPSLIAAGNVSTLTPPAPK